MTEQDTIAAERKLVHHKDKVEVLEREGKKLNNLFEKEKHGSWNPLAGRN